MLHPHRTEAVANSNNFIVGFIWCHDFNNLTQGRCYFDARLNEMLFFSRLS